MIRKLDRINVTDKYFFDNQGKIIVSQNLVYNLLFADLLADIFFGCSCLSLRTHRNKVQELQVEIELSALLMVIIGETKLGSITFYFRKTIVVVFFGQVTKLLEVITVGSEQQEFVHRQLALRKQVKYCPLTTHLAQFPLGVLEPCFYVCVRRDNCNQRKCLPINQQTANYRPNFD
jgi:hypothetical protein